MAVKISRFGRLQGIASPNTGGRGRMRRRHSLAGFFVFCLLIAACGAPLHAAMTGGIRKISSLSITSGGGASANGATALNAANIGGLTASGARLTGGNMSMTAGAVPAVITFATAKNDLTTAHCYPVPFKPSAGHTGITFTGLTRSARIRIYTISGELVRTLDKADAGETLDWNARNSRGAAVDSGVYLWLIESATQKKKGKLMIIR